MNIKIAYDYIIEFITEAEKLNSPLFEYKGINLLRSSFSDMNSCLLNYFSDVPKPWIKPVTAKNKFVQTAKRIWYGQQSQSIDSDKVIVIQITSTLNLKQLYPLAIELRKNGYGVLFVCYKRLLANQVIKLGFPVKCCVPTSALTTAEVAELTKLVKSLSTKIKWLDDEIATRFVQIIEAVHSTASGYSYDIKRIVKKYNPVFSIIGNDILRDGSIVTSILKKSGIKTSVMMHAIITKDFPIYKNIDVDYYFVFGEYFRDHFTHFGLPSDHIFACGAPAFDRVTSSAKSKVNSKLGIEEGRKYVLVTFSGAGNAHPPEQHIATLSVLKELIANYPHQFFVIKLHAKDRVEYYSDIINQGFKNIKIVTNTEPGFEDINIFDYLSSAKAIISILSSTIWEAMYMDVPCMSIDVWGKYDNVEFLDNRLVWRVNNASEAKSALEQMIDVGDNTTKAKINSAAKFAEGVFGPKDGKSSERIVNIITSVVGK